MFTQADVVCSAARAASSVHEDVVNELSHLKDRMRSNSFKAYPDVDDAPASIRGIITAGMGSVLSNDAPKQPRSE